MLKEIGRTTSNSLQSFARPDLSAEVLAGYAQYTISFEVFTPLLLSYVITLLEILSLLTIRKTGEETS
jgi:hypothetical protein